MEASVVAPSRRSWSRRLWTVVPALAFVGLLVFAVFKQSGLPAPGDPAPAFTAETLEGDETLSLADLRGKPVLLNFWASWCTPCEAEGPILSRASKRYAGKVHVVGVNIRDSRPDALAFAARYDLDYAHVWDPNLAVYDDYGLTGQPETFFIDGDGRIFEHVAGPVTEDLVLTYLDALVDG